jgi:hypothetical protein
VTFNNGGASIGSSTLSGGTACFSSSSMRVGYNTITVSYSGDANFTGSNSAALTQTVNKDATTSLVSTSGNPSVFGQSVTFTAAVSANAPGSGTPTGSVTFNDGGASIGSGTLSGGTASFSTSTLTVGNHTITVSYSGDANFTGSNSAALTQTVNKDATTSLVSTSGNPSVFGQSVRFMATVSASAPGSGTPTGTVTFNDGGASIGSVTLTGGTASFSTSTLTVGNHTITVSYSGDANFTSSNSAALTQTVNKDATTSLVSTNGNPSVFGQSVTFTATVSANTPGSGTPTGTVTFNDGGASIGSGALSGGSAAFATSSLSVGNHTITVSYSGDGNFNASTSAGITQTVNKAGSAATVVSNLNPAIWWQTITFTATVSAASPGAGTPTGTVTFNDGGVSFGSGTLSGGTASFSTLLLTAGTHTITASYGGDGNFNASASGNLTQTIIKATTTTTVTSSINPSSSGTSVTFTAAVAAQFAGPVSGTVTFNDGGMSIGSGTLSHNQTTFSTSALAVGNHTITAVYSGDSNVNSSTSAAITQTVNSSTSSTTTTIMSSNNPSVYGNSVTFTATVTSISTVVNTGTVTFLDGAATLGSEAVSSGTASLSTSMLTAGTHTITASYSDSSGSFGSSSGSLMQTVNQRPLTITANSTTKHEGDTLTFAGTEFMTNGLVNGDTVTSVTLMSGGAAAAAEDASYDIVPSNAQGSGLSNYSITYVNGTLTVNETLINGSSAVLAPLVEGGGGQSGRPTIVATFTHANGVEASGDFSATVDWAIAGHHADPATIFQNGDGSYTITADRPVYTEDGVYTVTISIFEDNSFTNTRDSQEVDEPAINGSSATLAPITTIDPPATVEVATFTHANGIEPSSDFAVTVDWGIDGHHADPGSVTQDGSGTYHASSTRPAFPMANTYTVTVSISEDNVSTTVMDTLVVNSVQPGPTTTTLSSSANPSVFGQTVTFTATVTPNNGVGTPSGTVTFMDGSASLGTIALSGGQATLTTSSLAVATHTISAMYNGDPNFFPSTSTAVNQTVNQDGTTTKITSSDNPSDPGELLTMTITVSANAPGSGTPTGLVTLAIPGKVTFGTMALDGTGHATFAIGSQAAGTHLLSASYTGDTNFLSSSGSLIQTVGAKSGSTTTVTSSPNPSRLGSAVTFTAIVSGAGNTPTGSVTFLDGKISLATMPLNASAVATFTTSSLSAGRHNIYAKYSGDVKYNSSSSNVVTQSVKSLSVSTVVASQAAVSQQPIINPAPLSLVVSPPTAPAAALTTRVDAGATVSVQSGKALERLAMSGALSGRHVAENLKSLPARDGSGSRDLAAIDRFFSEF